MPFIFPGRTKEGARLCKVCASYDWVHANSEKVERDFPFLSLSYYFANIPQSCSRSGGCGSHLENLDRVIKTVLAGDKSMHMGVGSNAQAHLPQQMVSWKCFGQYSLFCHMRSGCLSHCKLNEGDAISRVIRSDRALWGVAMPGAWPLFWDMPGIFQGCSLVILVNHFSLWLMD